MSRIMIDSIGDLAQTAYLEMSHDLEVGPGRVSVEMEAATVNLADFRLAAGTYTDRVTVKLPAPMGTEGVGRVTRVGQGVDRALLGSRVILLPNHEQGTWADRVVAPAHSVVPVPRGADAGQLAMLAVNPATAYLLLTRYTTLESGDWIGQNMGNSAVGRYIIALAKHAGIRTLSVVRREQAAAQLRMLGGDIVLVEGEDLAERAAEALGTGRLRMVFDGVGGSTPADLAQLLEDHGKVVSYSSAGGTPVAVPARLLVYRELSVHGFWVVDWIRRAPRAEIEAVYNRLGDLVARGVLHAEIAATFPLERFQDAFAEARRPQRQGKVLFTFPQEYVGP